MVADRIWRRKEPNVELVRVKTLPLAKHSPKLTLESKIRVPVRTGVALLRKSVQCLQFIAVSWQQIIQSLPSTRSLSCRSLRLFSRNRIVQVPQIDPATLHAINSAEVPPVSIEAYFFMNVTRSFSHCSPPGTTWILCMRPLLSRISCIEPGR